MLNNTPRSKNGHPLVDDSLLIAMGVYDGIGCINKFGTNPVVGTVQEDIWEQGGTWVPMAAASTLDVSSSSANDTAAGTGMRTLRIEGLDANFNVLNETVTLNGQTPVVTSGVFLRVNRVVGTTGGSGTVNAGDIYVADDSTAHTAGVPNTAAAIQSKVAAGVSRSQLGRYTVPAGKTAFVTNFYVIASANKTVDFVLCEFDTENGINHTLMHGALTDSTFFKPYTPEEAIQEKVTLIVRASVNTQTALVTSGFDLIIVDNNRRNP